VQKIISTMMALALSALPALAAQGKNIKETDRLENAGTVLEEILNIPDDIPPDLLDKAECIVIFPSVIKFAIGIGGSYGRGAMVAAAVNTSPGRGAHLRWRPWRAEALGCNWAVRRPISFCSS